MKRLPQETTEELNLRMEEYLDTQKHCKELLQACGTVLVGCQRKLVEDYSLYLYKEWADIFIALEVIEEKIEIFKKEVEHG